jgi:hypothetical protein
MKLKLEFDFEIDGKLSPELNLSDLVIQHIGNKFGGIVSEDINQTDDFVIWLSGIEEIK